VNSSTILTGSTLNGSSPGDLRQVVLDQVRGAGTVECRDRWSRFRRRWNQSLAVGRSREQTRLEKFDSNEEADARAERIRVDLEILGLEAWCERYDVPLEFVKQ
jgi:hypothetical protein